MAKIVYLRTDKNGTKYYANYTCPRCGGAGGSDKWAFTGWTCYECGGTGERPTPVIEKEYTPEYRAKLDERARKRAEAKRAKQVEEFNNNRLAIAEKYGFNPEGKIYVVTGNTYEIREELREAGAKYRGGINWYFLEKQDRLLLVLPMEVLMDHYWKKTYAKKIPEFTELVLQYYERWQNGELDMDEMKKDLWEYGGVRLEEREAE